jgi:Xaa-Pro aminopeptidase
MFENRIRSLRNEFDDREVDTVWIIQPENRRYLSGFRAPDGQPNESSGSLFVSQDHALLLTDSRYSTQAEGEAIGFEVITQKGGLIDTLPEVFDRLGTRRLGFEGSSLVWDLYEQVKEKASHYSAAVVLVNVSGLVEGMREIKEPQEIAVLRRSALLMGEVLTRVIEELKPGQVEKEVAWKIETLIREHGAEGSAFPPIVASGSNGALPHALPTDRKIRKNEPIVLDVGARVEGYCSDMTRTVFLGEPPARFKKIYQVVRGAQISALESVRPGMASNEADALARDIIKRAGFGDFFGHSLGHGVGLATHEKPSVGPLKSRELKEGMVFTIEPGIYIPGKGGVRLEEMILLERDGARILTTEKHFYSF